MNIVFWAGDAREHQRTPSRCLWGTLPHKISQLEFWQSFFGLVEQSNQRENIEKASIVVQILGRALVQRRSPQIDERQITHLICARLKYDLYDFLGGVLGLLYKKKNRKQA